MVRYYWLRRKNKLPADGAIVMKLFVPSLERLPVGVAVQLVVLKSGFCYKVQPVEQLFQYGQEIVRPLVACVVANFGVGVAT